MLVSLRTYPDVLLDVPFPDAYEAIVLRTPAEKLDAIRLFVPGIFHGEGITVPEKFKYMMGSGFRYLLQTKRDISLLDEAYREFSRKVRWRYFWHTRGQTGGTWDDKLKLLPRVKADAPAAHTLVEAGLRDGWEALIAQARVAVPLVAHSESLSWDKLAELQSYLRSEKILVKTTDKNLGVAVVKLDWYVDQCMRHLSNTRIFTEVAYDDIPFSHHADLIGEILDADVSWTEQERKFLQDALAMRSIPRFHGIPKIHKKPWALGPIVPAFGWFSCNPAKLACKRLKSLYAQFPRIVQSTKEVTDKIDAVRIPPGRKAYLCTGDVAAMYTNIPTQGAHALIGNMFRRTTMRPGMIDAMMKCIDTANDHTYVSFQDRYFRQIDGLAMGSPCSPDVANLYTGELERRRFAKYPNANVLMYVRYIDDIFMIVLADSVDEALKCCPSGIGLLSLEWSASDLRLHFLDVEVFIMPGTSEVRYKPYRKPLNHYSRIPWTSSHPKQVKKAVLNGELTRLATCSSHREYYIAASDEFRGALLARGWPTAVVHAWYHEARDKRWLIRKNPVEKDAITDVLVIATKYNPIWESVRVDKVRDAIHSRWGNVPDLSTFKDFFEALVDARITIAYSRTTSLGDLVNTWNKALLTEHIEEVETLDFV